MATISMTDPTQSDVWRAVIKASRVPFLILAPVNVLLGVAASVGHGYPWTSVELALVFLGALAAHASVNLINEYFDFRSGLDGTTQRTPFSGGSGALVMTPQAARAVLYAGIGTLVLTILIGLRFVAIHGGTMLPIGLLGVAIIVLYTPWLNRRPWLCLVSPGIAFGPLMVIGTSVALTGEITPLAVFVSIVPGCLTNTLLLVNQYPDIEPDRRVGRRHLPIVYGRRTCALVYAVHMVVAAGAIVYGIASHVLPMASALALIPLAGSIPVYIATRAVTITQESLLRSLGINVALSLVTPFVLALTILVAG